MLQAELKHLQHMFSHNRTMLGLNILRTLSSTSRLYASHYDALGISPKATQNEIKSAYYKLSKIHHPDKSNDEASANKFRSITEAYEVLGNVKLKKMYDRGLLGSRLTSSHVDYQPEPEPTDPTLRFYKSRQSRHVAPTMGGAQNVYDFDAWSKNHYGELFEKQKYQKELLRKKREKHQALEESTRQEALMYLVIAVTTLFIFLVVNGQDNYDKDMLAKSKAKPEEKDKQ